MAGGLWLDRGYVRPMTLKGLTQGALLLSTLTVVAACDKKDDAPKAEVKDAPAEGSKAAEENEKAEKATDAKVAAGEATSIDVDVAKSTIGFRGEKVTGGHDGSFKDFSGKVVMEDKTPTSLEFTVKMESVESDADKLTSHLKSDDFFAVDEHPESTFKSTKITKKAGEKGATHEIEGELTLRGVTKIITFPAKVEISDDEAKGSAEFAINRKDFEIKYEGMKDDLIKDDVTLKLDLVFPMSAA